MKKAIIAGASGMIGNLILEHCLVSADVAEVTSLVRRKTNKEHSKLKEVAVDNFEEYSEQIDLFLNVDIAFFCIGVYTGQVSDKEFKKITVDYAVAFAKAVRSGNPNASLCLLSGAGADRTEKSIASFSRYKGMAENQIAELGLHFYAFRPGYIYPVTPRKAPNIIYRILRILYPLIRLAGSNSSIKSNQLAEAMFKVAIHGANTEVLENKTILSYLH
ncbi:MAG: hypothetical protein AAF717_12745 [Bacteroidota bacterium]